MAMTVPAAALVVIGAVLAAARALLLVVTVTGRSMEPSCPAGRRLLVLRTPFGRARTGALVVFRHSPAEPSTPDEPPLPPLPLLVKRLAAGPGEPVPEAVREAAGARPGDVVPPGRLVLLGDNAAESVDSRMWGHVPAGDVVGVVVGRLGGPGQRGRAPERDRADRQG